MAKQFPGMVHVLTVYPDDGEEPKVNESYKPIQDNLVAIWGDGRVNQYKPNPRMKHWLIKPHHESWNLDQARNNFLNFSQNAGRVIYEKGILSHFGLSEALSKLCDSTLNSNHAEELWVLIVHVCGNISRYDDDWRNFKTSWMNNLCLDTSVPDLKHGYYEVQKDFFLESSMVITRLLELEKQITLEGNTRIEHSDKWPDDLITFAVAEEKYIVSRSTLKRAVKDSRLKSYRPDNCSNNHLHKVSESQISSLWPAKPPSS